MSNHSEFGIDRRRALLVGGSALVATLVGVGASTAASADPTGKVAAGPVPVGSPASVDLTADQIAAADKYVTLSGLHYDFNEDAAKKELDAETVDKVRSAVAAWNDNAGGGTAGGGLVAHAGGKILYTGPHGSISAHWYGLKIKFDSYLAGKVMAGTATASAIAAGIGLASAETAVGGIAGGVVAAALAAASSVIGLCQDEDGSVTWYWLLNGLGACNPFA